MNASHDKVRREMKEAMAQLRALRDEAALKIHLAGMDAKKTWDQLQPKLAEAEKGAEEATAAALVSVQQTARKLKELVHSL